MQLTAVSSCGAPTVDGAFHGWSGAPVTITRPAWGDVATELPTVTHVPMAVHETPLSEADRDVTVWLDQVAPPLAVVRMSPCPALAASRMVAVVPTTVQRAPGIPTIGAVVVVDVGGAVVVVVVGAVLVGVGTDEPEATVAAVLVVGGGAVVVVDGTGTAPLPVGDPLKHEMPLNEPAPGGVATMAQLVPPSAVRDSAPATWSRATVVWPVTQQRWSPVQERALAPDMVAGRGPAGTQDAPEVVDTRATEPVGADPTAMHQPSGWQETAVRSRTPAGAGTWVHCAPPSAVEMITA